MSSPSAARIGMRSSSSSCQRSGWSGRSSRGMTALDPAEVVLVDGARRDEERAADVELRVEERLDRASGAPCRRGARSMISGRRVDGDDLEVVPGRAVEVDGHAPAVEHLGEPSTTPWRAPGRSSSRARDWRSIRPRRAARQCPPRSPRPRLSHRGAGRLEGRMAPGIVTRSAGGSERDGTGAGRNMRRPGRRPRVGGSTRIEQLDLDAVAAHTVGVEGADGRPPGPALHIVVAVTRPSVKPASRSGSSNSTANVPSSSTGRLPVRLAHAEVRRRAVRRRPAQR